MPKTSTRPPFAKKPAHQLPPRPLQLQNERLGSWLRPLLKQKKPRLRVQTHGILMGLQWDFNRRDCHGI